MRSRAPDTDADLHARARIRNAAIHQFATSGFDVGLRAIAAEAGVSAPLIIRHFGSKAGLREVCDDYVLRLVRDAKTATVSTGEPAAILRALAEADEYGHATLYVLASLAEGGALGRELFEHLVADAVDYLEAGVANGVIKPSRDPVARARYLTQAGLGGALLELRLTTADGDPPDVATFMRTLEGVSMLPALELYTEGLFTDGRILETVLTAQQIPHDVAPDPPTGHERR